MQTQILRSTRPFLSIVALAFLAACAPNDQRAGATPAPPATQADAERLARLYAEDAYWPTRVWLEEPIVSESGEVLVKPHRPGVLMYVRPDGVVRVDFGRHGPHTVPVQQTNLVSESARVRSGEAPKTFPNLLGMLMNRVVRSDTDELEVMHLAAEDIRGGGILLVFADSATGDVPSLVELATRVEEAGHVTLTTFVPITDELDGDVLADLGAGGWSDPFVMTPMAHSYVPAMLEPDTPHPWLRLCSDEGRILAEGPPTEATVSRMRETLKRIGT